MDSKIKLNSIKVQKEKKAKKIIKIILLVLLLLLTILYFIIGIIYNNGNFTITLDRNLYFEKGLIIYDDPNYKVYRSELYVGGPDSFDNISARWLPDNLNDFDGSHNGDNYMAYTFYIENTGNDVSDYWSEIIVEDVIRNVDEAVRIRVYKDGVYETYAKMGANGSPESGTVPFESDTIVKSDHVENFSPGDIIKYTIVLWLDGNDPECTDNILGGEFKAYMAFNSEFVEK